MIGFAAERLMELEVGAATGYGEKTPLRLAQSNGYRERDWEARALLNEPGLAAVRADRRQAKAFLEQPIEGDWPFLWIDATYHAEKGNHPVWAAADA